MRTEGAVSEKTLQRLWSEIALLRQEIEKAERDRATSLVQLNSAIAGARARLGSRSDQYLSAR